MSGKYFSEATLIACYGQFQPGGYRFAPFDGMRLEVPSWQEVWLWEGDFESCLEFVEDRYGQVIGRHNFQNDRGQPTESLLVAQPVTGMVTILITPIAQGDETVPAKLPPAKQMSFWETVVALFVWLFRGLVPQQPEPAPEGQELIKSTMAKLSEVVDSATAMDFSPWDSFWKLRPEEEKDRQKAYASTKKRWCERISKAAQDLCSGLDALGDACGASPSRLGTIDKAVEQVRSAWFTLGISQQGFEPKLETTGDGKRYVLALCDVYRNVTRIIEFRGEDDHCVNLSERARAALRNRYSAALERPDFCPEGNHVNV